MDQGLRFDHAGLGADLDAVEVERLTGGTTGDDDVVPLVVGDLHAAHDRPARGRTVPQVAAKLAFPVDEQTRVPHLRNGSQLGVLQTQQDTARLVRAEPQLNGERARPCEGLARHRDGALAAVEGDRAVVAVEERPDPAEDHSLAVGAVAPGGDLVQGGGAAAVAEAPVVDRVLGPHGICVGLGARRVAGLGDLPRPAVLIGDLRGAAGVAVVLDASADPARGQGGLGQLRGSGAGRVVCLDRARVEGAVVDRDLVHGPGEAPYAFRAAVPAGARIACAEVGEGLSVVVDHAGGRAEAGAVEVERLLGARAGQDGVVPRVVGDDAGRGDGRGPDVLELETSVQPPLLGDAQDRVPPARFAVRQPLVLEADERSRSVRLEPQFDRQHGGGGQRRLRQLHVGVRTVEGCRLVARARQSPGAAEGDITVVPGVHAGSGDGLARRGLALGLAQPPVAGGPGVLDHAAVLRAAGVLVRRARGRRGRRAHLGQQVALVGVRPGQGGSGRADGVGGDGCDVSAAPGERQRPPGQRIGCLGELAGRIGELLLAPMAVLDLGQQTGRVEGMERCARVAQGPAPARDGGQPAHRT